MNCVYCGKETQVEQSTSDFQLIPIIIHSECVDAWADHGDITDALLSLYEFEHKERDL